MVFLRQSLFRVMHLDSHLDNKNLGVDTMKDRFEQEKCVECRVDIPPYRKYLCEECFAEMLKEKAQED